jgi:hypothetical protein
MAIKEKRKLFSLISLFKFSDRPAPDLGGNGNEDLSPGNKAGYALADADEWPLHVDGYYSYTKFNNDGFYN